MKKKICLFCWRPVEEWWFPFSGAKWPDLLFSPLSQMETKSSNLSVLLEEGVKRGRVKMDIETEIRWAYLIFATFITLTHLETGIFYTIKCRYKGQGRFCEKTTFLTGFFLHPSLSREYDDKYICSMLHPSFYTITI